MTSGVIKVGITRVGQLTKYDRLARSKSGYFLPLVESSDNSLSNFTFEVVYEDIKENSRVWEIVCEGQTVIWEIKCSKLLNWDIFRMRCASEAMSVWLHSCRVTNPLTRNRTEKWCENKVFRNIQIQEIVLYTRGVQKKKEEESS